MGGTTELIHVEVLFDGYMLLGTIVGFGQSDKNYLLIRIDLNGIM